jgi:Ca2+/Na+ antiporter
MEHQSDKAEKDIKPPDTLSQLMQWLRANKSYAFFSALILVGLGIVLIGIDAAQTVYHLGSRFYPHGFIAGFAAEFGMEFIDDSAFVVGFIFSLFSGIYVSSKTRNAFVGCIIGLIVFVFIIHIGDYPHQWWIQLVTAPSRGWHR